MSETKNAKIERLEKENESLTAERVLLVSAVDQSHRLFFETRRERDGLRAALLEEKDRRQQASECFDSTLSRLFGLRVNLADALGIETAPGEDEDGDTILVDTVRALVLGADTPDHSASRAAGRQEAFDVVLDHLRTRLSDLDARAAGKSPAVSRDREPLARIAGAQTEVAVLMELARQTMLTSARSPSFNELVKENLDLESRLVEANESHSREVSELTADLDQAEEVAGAWRSWACVLLGKDNEDADPAADLRAALESAYTHQVTEREKADKIAHALRLVAIGERRLNGLGFRWAS